MSRSHQFQALVLLSFLYLLFEVEALSMSFQFSFAEICCWWMTNDHPHS
ncbi:MAG: hypothetical protein RID09_00960 [Coleofasciculus sp. G1-WW12-02]